MDETSRGRPARAGFLPAALLGLAFLGSAGLLALVLSKDPPAREAAPVAHAGTPIAFDAAALAGARPLAATVVGRVRPVETPVPAAAGAPAPAPAGRGFRHQWPAVYATARFEGEALVAAFDDGVNRYRIAFDGAPGQVIDRPGRRAFRFDGLGPGPHEVRIEKISESSGPGTFVGFFVPPEGVPLAPPAPRARRIEFIGDSDTVGYGNLASGRDCAEGEVFRLTDTARAFGPQVARRFGADHQVIARSGVGVVRNHGGAAPGAAMTRLYPRLLPDDPAPHEPRDWRPQIVVAALGTNDFATPLAAGEAWADEAALRADFEAAYARFLRALRARYPQALLLVLAFDDFDAEAAAAVRAAAEAVTAEGEDRLDVVSVPELGYRGCHWHPSGKDHDRMAEILGNHIEARSGAWEGR